MSAGKAQRGDTGHEAAEGAGAEEIEVTGAAADVLAELKDELDKAVEARQRALADFANFQRRATQNERQAVRDGETRVVRSMLDVLDHFDLALDQDESRITVPQLLGGVKIVRDELYRALESYGVARITPQAGEEFDPNRHQAVLQQAAPGIAPNHVVVVLQPGYLMGETVLRPAKVAVAPCGEEGA